jgi:1-pyrroline-5-carboxylate dehydrogenase
MTDAPAPPRIKITYATLRNDNEELHRQFDAGREQARALLGGSYRNFVAGQERDGEGTFQKRSPIDGTLIGTFATGTRGDVQDAIAAARAAFPAWSRRPWQERVALLRRVADLISERLMLIGAVVAMEVGKNRLEALGDVEETADLIRWSCDMVEQNDGFDHPMGDLGDPTVHTRSVLKPYGVWGIISPFNIPFALSGGPSGGALVAGNTVVYKPSSDTPLSGVLLTRVMRDAGIPDGVFNMVMGPGETVGDQIQTDPGVDGILFTGSFEVGYRLYQEFPRPYPKPVIVEMGGKNPAIVTASADLDEAAEGVMRAAFGLSGQKCSANSRVYVERPVYDRFLALLVDKATAIAVGDPLERQNWMGPVINDKAVARYEAAVEEARSAGAVVLGGERLTGPGYEQGTYVAPTIVTGLPADHRLLRDELFLPFVVVLPVDSLDEALRLSNANIQGLTAGIYSEDPAEQQRFLD